MLNMVESKKPRNVCIFDKTIYIIHNNRIDNVWACMFVCVCMSVYSSDGKFTKKKLYR